MPPLLNRLVHVTDGEDCDPAIKEKGCAVDDFYFPPILRFNAQDIRTLEPFDFALTRELFGSGDKMRDPVFPDPIMRPELIVSQRFRKWCEKKKLKVYWMPVTLE